MPGRFIVTGCQVVGAQHQRSLTGSRREPLELRSNRRSWTGSVDERRLAVSRSICVPRWVQAAAT